MLALGIAYLAASVLGDPSMCAKVKEYSQHLKKNAHPSFEQQVLMGTFDTALHKYGNIPCAALPSQARLNDLMQKVNWKIGQSAALPSQTGMPLVLNRNENKKLQATIDKLTSRLDNITCHMAKVDKDIKTVQVSQSTMQLAPHDPDEVRISTKAINELVSKLDKISSDQSNVSDKDIVARAKHLHA